MLKLGLSDRDLVIARRIPPSYRDPPSLLNIPIFNLDASHAVTGVDLTYLNLLKIQIQI